MSVKIDLSLTNATLYAGCGITEVAGRLNLTTPVVEAVNLVGRTAEMIERIGITDEDLAEIMADTSDDVDVDE